MTQQKQIADVPIKWHGKEYTATHALSCPCATIDYGDDMHEFRILDKRGGYLFHERTPFVVKHATELWSEDDPFALRALHMNGE